VDPTNQQYNNNPPPPSNLTPSEYALRIAEIQGGLFLVAGGMVVADLGILVVATALTEMIGGVATGIFAPLVEIDAGMGLAWGSLMTLTGLSISGVGGYLVYIGLTGAKP